ncbi:hypothetical protein QA600_09885 [Natronococcus sp. A-GB1]|uniref:hypothetical protein n=1 Tax=Natronococcus sp. A-GB1 TaxID=3037648 RepID=UPI00241DF26E|nr:hypothetical protein [Natronococcus sp. A-GB1]MDG5759650.1 hypothetical protein [Natronococcus sp. A-GB1]
MKRTRITSDDQYGVDYYLPGTPTAFETPANLVEALNRLFRPRGRIGAERERERTNR